MEKSHERENGSMSELCSPSAVSASTTHKEEAFAQFESRSDGTKKTFDGLLVRHLGQFGRYQWFIFLCLAVTAVAATCHNLLHVFTGAVPHYQCATFTDTNGNETLTDAKAPISLGSRVQNYAFNDSVGNLNVTANQCTRSINNGSSGEVPCNQWVYDTSQYGSSIVTEWDLVCDRKWLPSFIQSLHMLGCMIGSLLFGELSDRFGRRPILLVTTSMDVAIGICTAFLPGVELYAVFRLVIGMAIAGQFNCAYIIAVELVGPKWRGVASVMMLYMASLGIMVMAGLAYLIRQWRHLQLAISAPLGVLLVYFIVAPESPRWMLAHNRMKGANVLIGRMAKYNGKTLPQDYKDWLNHDGQTDKRTDRRYSVLDLFKTPQIRTKTITLAFIWFVISVTYYGLSLYTSNLGGNDYLNFFLSGAVELPAYTFSIWCLQRFGRRVPLCISMCLSGCCLLLTSPFGDDQHVARIALSMCGKMCISVAYVIIYPFSVEVFPTVIRSNGLGLVSIGARVGGFVAPYILLLGDVSTVIPLVVCGTVALTGGIFGIILPETNNMALPETIEDAEAIRNNSIKQFYNSICLRCKRGGTPSKHNVSVIDEGKVFLDHSPRINNIDANDQHLSSHDGHSEQDRFIPRDPSAHEHLDHSGSTPCVIPSKSHSTSDCPDVAVEQSTDSDFL